MLAPERGGRAGSGSLPATGLIEAARRVAADVLAPAAQVTDQASVVPVSNLRALAAAGLMGLSGPVDHGGNAVPPAVAREVFEILAGACGATFFVWVQHHAPVRMLAGSANQDLRRRLLPPLCAGSLLGGVAFAHLRRPGAPPVRVRPVAGGYVIDGEAPWVTSWGLAGVFAVAGRVGEDRVLFAAVPGEVTEQVRPSPRLRLAAMSATSTVRVAFHGHHVDEGDVIAELFLADWRARDRVATAQPHPAAFGVAGTAIRLLEDLEPTVAAAMEAERLDCRDQSYRFADDDRTDDAYVAHLLDLRAWSLDVALRAAYALVAATGGRSMELSHPAQRLLREAAFYAIQAQTADLRRATLGRLTARAAAPPGPPPPPPT